ncbi:hypothetical protein M4C14_19995 [Klebsiella pneumoniae]|uniref:hypothetical protein n=1 Tax=Klebsiella pneumoniae complex TaxID=3390273 RepID=UPI000D74E210|nr:hypothetical protein [Klebsiella variicola]MCM6691228.1 hypothetical protein [Klebsiella pneumoniae]HCB0786405.1 hypothetical protein [Klebsiella variicola subsp. variicola]HDK6877102.1 hypothetical protein [Klebsiella quasipneumoniae]MCP5918907.1 hypothetical protein [Klebsiella pneumoniae]MCP6293640.1 hypothetical protein [Klebsiella pneumoniae]
MTNNTELTSIQKNANIHRLSRLIAYASNDELRQMAVEVEHYTDQLIEALEKAQGMEAYWKTQCRGITDHCEELQARIAELEREQEHLRPVGVMSEKAFHRLENSECRFIALWPRPGIFLPRKRPEDGVIVYARTAAAAGIKVEAE